MFVATQRVRWGTNGLSDCTLEQRHVDKVVCVALGNLPLDQQPQESVLFPGLYFGS